MTLRVLSLFAGIGGLDLGLHRVLACEAAGYVELDPYCCRVLRARVEDGSLPHGPVIEEDIRGIDFARFGRVDFVRAQLVAAERGAP